MKRKPGRPRKNPVVENVGAQAQASVGSQAAERKSDASKLLVEIDAAVTSAFAAANNKKRIEPAELAAIHREAWEAFDYDAPRGKTDSLGRIWAFDPDIKGGQKIVDLSVRRVGQLKRGTQITVPAIGYQEAREVVEQIVNRLNEEVA